MSKEEKLKRKAAAKMKQMIKANEQSNLWQEYMTGFFNSAYHRNVAGSKCKQFERQTN